MKTLQTSPNFDRRYEIGRCFPFHEGFPNVGLTDRKWFKIFVEGRGIRIVRVDFSTQYRAEGLCWKTEDGEIIKEHLVFAWEECPAAQEILAAEEE